MAKNNKLKGFTLIELMVVISIIALLSSVVLASVKSARDRADNTKIASEMKSLQTALELYKAQFGIYPNIAVDEEENNCYFYCGGFNNFVKTYLVDNKFIGKVPQSKGYPNNCIDYCYQGNMFFYLGKDYIYEYITPSYEHYYMCGGKKVTSGYVLGYLTKETLNLPKFTYYYRSGPTTEQYYTGFIRNDVNSTDVNEYCLSI
jgi:prepilin-type N-terminal cleavage/methylation domain-containing protein